MNHKALYLICALLLTLWGCRGSAPPGMPPIPVTAAKVQVSPAPNYIDAIGVLAAMESVDIFPQVSGRIDKIHFKQGADVKAGELLFGIDPAPYSAALHDAEAKLAAHQAELALNQAQLKRSLSLVSGNYVSAQDIDTLRARVKVSEAAIKAAQAAVETASINLDYCSIRSPIDGVAGKYLINEGNVVAAYAQTPLVTIRNVEKLYLDFSIPEGELRRLQQALGLAGSLKVQTSLLADPALSGEAELKYVDNQVVSGSGMVPLRADLENHTRIFWPGQAVSARVILSITPNALLVPYQALQFGQQGSFVFVVKEGNIADIKVVTPGQRQGDLIVIEKGLTPDDTVVLTGQLMLSPGAPVMLMPPPGTQMQQASVQGGPQTMPPDEPKSMPQER